MFKLLDLSGMVAKQVYVIKTYWIHNELAKKCAGRRNIDITDTFLYNLKFLVVHNMSKCTAIS